MKHRIATLTTSIVLFAAFAPRANARDYLQCKDLPASARSQCEQQAEKCKKLAEYWDRRRCEDEIADKADPCRSQAWDRACKAHTPRMLLCSRPDVDSEKLDAWSERAEKVPAFARAHEAFVEQWAACLDNVPGRCAPQSHLLKSCKDVAGAYTAAWQSYTTDVTKNLKRELERIRKRREREADKPSAISGRVHRIAAFIASLEQHAKIAATVAVAKAADNPDFEQLIAVWNDEQAAEEALEEQLLASARCPKPRYRNAALTKRLGRAARDRGFTPARISLEAAPRKHRLSPLTVAQDVHGHVCEKPEKPASKRCRVTGITWRRTKNNGGSWGPWELLIGDIYEMLCRNL